MHCIPPMSAKVTDFTLHCQTKVITLETKTPDGKYRTFAVDLTPLFTNCDGEDIFPLRDTRFDNPNVSNPNDDEVTLSFDVIDVLTGNVIDVQSVKIPVGTGEVSPHNHDAGTF